jgi:inosine-uridine nucleoside N-ribohydrolase
VKRVVMMGGSIDRGYDGANGDRRGPDAEWNILQDPKGAQKLFASGVPIFMMPLDSTQIHLKTVQRDKLFATDNSLTDQITLLYHQWIMPSREQAPTPTLFDPVAASYIFRPDLCPAQPMRIAVDDKGFTRKTEGAPNANVCLKSDEGGFLSLLLNRLEMAAK